MSSGLYSSIYGAPSTGIYEGLYSRKGASPPVKSEDIRLGGLGGLGVRTEGLRGLADAEPSSLFAKQIAGIPLWLVGIGLVAFAYVARKRRASV